MTSAARKARRKDVLALRRKAKKLGIERGSRRYMVWMLLISETGRTPEQAKAQMDDWDAEQIHDQLGVRVGEGTL